MKKQGIVVVYPGYKTLSGKHEVHIIKNNKIINIRRFKKWDDEAMISGENEAKKRGFKLKIHLYDYDDEDYAKKGTYNDSGGRIGLGIEAYMKGSAAEKALLKKGVKVIERHGKVIIREVPSKKVRPRILKGRLPHMPRRKQRGTDLGAGVFRDKGKQHIRLE